MVGIFWHREKVTKKRQTSCSQSHFNISRAAHSAQQESAVGRESYVSSQVKSFNPLAESYFGRVNDFSVGAPAQTSRWQDAKQEHHPINLIHHFRSSVKNDRPRLNMLHSYLSAIWKRFVKDTVSCESFTLPLLTPSLSLCLNNSNSSSYRNEMVNSNANSFIKPVRDDRFFCCCSFRRLHDINIFYWTVYFFVIVPATDSWPRVFQIN